MMQGSNIIDVHIRARGRFLLMAGALLLLLLILSGCYGGEVNEEIWLNGNGRWKADLRFTLNADERELLKSELADANWDELVEAAASEDVSLKVSQHEEPDGGISYLMKISGQGLHELNENCFNGEAIIRKDDDGRIHISWDTGSSEYVYILREINLIIHGGEIISSNANTMEDDSASWHNPS